MSYPSLLKLYINFASFQIVQRHRPGGVHLQGLCKVVHGRPQAEPRRLRADGASAGVLQDQRRGNLLHLRERVHKEVPQGSGGQHQVVSSRGKSLGQGHGRQGAFNVQSCGCLSQARITFAELQQQGKTWFAQDRLDEAGQGVDREHQGNGNGHSTPGDQECLPGGEVVQVQKRY